MAAKVVIANMSDERSEALAREVGAGFLYVPSDCMDEDAIAKITAEHRAPIPTLLERGPEAYGFRGQIWTCKRVAEVIRRTTTNGAHPRLA
jgi:hypothetical protein